MGVNKCLFFTNHSEKIAISIKHFLLWCHYPLIHIEVRKIPNNLLEIAICSLA